MRLMEGADIYQIAKNLPHKRREDQKILCVIYKKHAGWSSHKSTQAKIDEEERGIS